MEFRSQITPSDAKLLQEKLRSCVCIEKMSTVPKVIAGVDVSSERFSNMLHATWIIFTYPKLQIVEKSFARVQTDFPYIPGYLSFREIPALLAARKKLKQRPHLVLVDGQGIAHPRGLGIASHLGLVLDMPTIGCAKSLLYGKGDLPASVGGTSEIRDPKTGDVIGVYMRTKKNASPIIISPGHKISLTESVEIVTCCLRGYRIPEPTRLAHEFVNAYRRGEIS